MYMFYYLHISVLIIVTNWGWIHILFVFVFVFISDQSLIQDKELAHFYGVVTVPLNLRAVSFLSFQVFLP